MAKVIGPVVLNKYVRATTALKKISGSCGGTSVNKTLDGEVVACLCATIGIFASYLCTIKSRKSGRSGGSSDAVAAIQCYKVFVIHVYNIKISNVKGNYRATAAATAKIQR